eukprot:TRINITY_DN2246_c0_g1_i1.p1 TRINITY_DN2246_c0_g1~~TRINITY_DN2246_c0_g1_i1.p1  ORF type:complete len:328 (+),score=34.27 TRINITY_DN2246_c0_g1_i1:79-1062(+)
MVKVWACIIQGLYLMNVFTQGLQLKSSLPKQVEPFDSKAKTRYRYDLYPLENLGLGALLGFQKSYPLDNESQGEIPKQLHTSHVEGHGSNESQGQIPKQLHTSNVEGNGSNESQREIPKQLHTANVEGSGSNESQGEIPKFSAQKAKGQSNAIAVIQDQAEREQNVLRLEEGNSKMLKSILEHVKMITPDTSHEAEGLYWLTPTQDIVLIMLLSVLIFVYVVHERGLEWDGTWKLLLSLVVQCLLICTAGFLFSHGFLSLDVLEVCFFCNTVYQVCCKEVEKPGHGWTAVDTHASEEHLKNIEKRLHESATARRFDGRRFIGNHSEL